MLISSAHRAPARVFLRQVVGPGIAALGGLLTAAAFPDVGLWPAAFTGVALLLGASGSVGAVHAAGLWSVWAVAFFTPHLVWSREAAGPLAWVALVLLQAGVLALTGAGWAWASRARIARGRLGRAGLFAAVWVVGEQVRSTVPFGGFPWGRLAFSQVDGPLLGLARLGGAPLVSFAVALGAAALTGAVLELRRPSVRSAAASVALGAAALLVGAVVPLPVDAEAGVLRVGVVQGDVPEDGSRPDRADVVLENHVAGTEELARDSAPGGLDLVVWPENAADVDPRTDARARARVDEAARAVGVPLLVGTNRYEPEGRYNDVLVWTPADGPAGSYAKQRPAPFGEYIPLRDLIRVFSREVDRVPVDMVAGSEPAVLDVPVARQGRAVRVATVICFEVAFDDVVREAALRGAELLVVPTNNASFGWTAQSTQQLAMSRLRAVETGRATIQASTVGVSAVILPDGAVLERTGLFTSQTMSATLPLRTSITPATRAGAWPPLGAALVVLGALLDGLTRGRRGSANDGPAARRGSVRRAILREPSGTKGTGAPGTPARGSLKV